MTGKCWYLTYKAPTGRHTEPIGEFRIHLDATSLDGAIAEARAMWPDIKKKSWKGYTSSESDPPFGGYEVHPEVVFRMPLLLE